MKIFLVAIGGDEFGLQGIAIAEDGAVLSSHFSSNEDWLRSDLTREFHLPRYAAHCPDGYTLEYVPVAEAQDHPGLCAAVALSSATPGLDRPCVDVDEVKT